MNDLQGKTLFITGSSRGIGKAIARCRTPVIVADAAYAILTSDSRQHTGNFYVDEPLLREHGVTDFDKYAVTPGAELLSDFFI